MWMGRAFQRGGAGAEKAPSPQVRRSVLRQRVWGVEGEEV